MIRPDHPSSGPFAEPKRRAGARVALLGAVGLAALGGALADSTLFARYPAAAAQSAIAPLTVPAVQPSTFADVVDRVKGAVVSVKVKLLETAAADEDGATAPGMPQFQPGDPLERFFKRFGQGQGQMPGMPKGKPHAGMAQGSGFIVSADGYVVTNNHVVENATEVVVTLDGGKTVSAKVIGTDKKTDLALLKLDEGSDYPHVEFAGGAPRVGDWVIAVGNPFGLGGTVTAGIVSARGRDIGAGPYDDFLQIDAPVNRGNSGGPTFNTAGQVVGVNTAIFSPSGGSVGIGFAIPSEVARDVVASLKDKGSVARGWIGVQIQPVTDEIASSLGLRVAKGALVSDAQANAPAAQAGVKSGDVITAVNGETVDGPKELARKIAAIGPDKKADLTVWHDGASTSVAVKLGTLPSEQQAKLEPARPEKTAMSSLGLSLAPASAVAGAGKEGVVVSDVDADGVAAQKGLKVGDVILEAGGKAVSRPAEIASALEAARKDGRKALLIRVKSGEGTRFVALATNQAG